MPGSFELPPFPPLPSFSPLKDAKSPSTEGRNSRGLLVWLVFLTIVSVGTSLGLMLHLRWQAAGQGPPPTTATPAPLPTPPASGPSEERPWGTIECVPITIAPPLEFVVQCVAGTDPIVWHVPNTDAKQLANTLSEIGLDNATRDQFVAIAEVNRSIHGVFLHPSRELILGLSSEARAKLYAFLSGFPQNADQVNAFRFAGESPDEWFAGCPLPPQVDKLVRRLLYRHGRFMFFADLRSIEGDLPSAEVRTRLLQTLSREKTFLAKVKITRASSVEKLVSYWGRGGRAKDIRPILESLAELEGEQTLDIVHMLPPFARRRIYTYPRPETTAEASKRDCHWTTFNFFSEQPDDRFCQPEEVLRTLERDYYRIHAGPQLGDVVMFVVNGSEAIHTAVYLADDIIFTKNGSSSSHPWMLMKLDHLRDFYPTHRPVEIRYFRRSD